MARSFEVAPQQVVLGTVTNGFRLTFYYDYTDHSLCKIQIDAIAGTLAGTQTMCVFNRHGLEIAAQRTTTIPAQDTSFAIPIELNSGDLCDSTVVHNAGFGV
jgi:hypothetical protein